MLAALALVVALSGQPSKAAPCSRIDWREGVVQRERLIGCLSRRFGRISYSTALSIARCESSPNLNPRTKYRGSLGMWQHQGHLWRARALRYLTPRWGLNPKTASPFNAYAATIVTFSMASDRNIGWGPWSCAR